MSHPGDLPILRDVEMHTLAPDEECPICRVPYTASLAEFGGEGTELLHQQRFLTLGALPFHHRETPHPDIDLPVRLPCTSGHVVGVACMRAWATEGGIGGTSCPLDREELLTPTARDQDQVTREAAESFVRGTQAIREMPVRELLRQFRNVTVHDRVTINAQSMVGHLATLLFRVVFHRSGVRVNPFFVRWPQLDNSRPLLSYEQAPAFRKLVQEATRYESLGDSGQYPAHIRTLQNPALPHIFVFLYRMAQLHQVQSISVVDITKTLQDRMRQFISEFEDAIVDHEQMSTIAALTIDLWVAQELLITQLRQEIYPDSETDDLPTSSSSPHGVPSFPLSHDFSITTQQVGYSNRTIPNSANDGGTIQRPTSLQKHADPRQTPVGPYTDRTVIHMPHEVYVALWESTSGLYQVTEEVQPSGPRFEDREDMISQALGIQSQSRSIMPQAIPIASQTPTGENTSQDSWVTGETPGHGGLG